MSDWEQEGRNKTDEWRKGRKKRRKNENEEDEKEGEQGKDELREHGIITVCFYSSFVGFLFLFDYLYRICLFYVSLECFLRVYGLNTYFKRFWGWGCFTWFCNGMYFLSGFLW